MHRVRRPATILLTLAGAAGVCLQAGCYQRAVSASGPGARKVEVYEPNFKNERIPIVDDVEDAVFGPKPTQTNKRKRNSR